MGRLDESGPFRDLPITEPVPIKDDFATGCEVVYHPEYVRLSFWADHPTGFGDNSMIATERVIVRKVIMTRGDFELAFQRYMKQRTERQRRNQ